MKQCGFIVPLICMLVSTAGNAQDCVDDIRHSLTLEIPNLFLKTISLSYNYKINAKYELRLNPKISFPSNWDNRIAGSKLVKDPFWYYNSYAMQIGLCRNFNQNVYLEPILYYKYGYFNDQVLQLIDGDGDSHDLYQKLSRQYNSGGLILRSGIKVDKDHLRLNFFYGAGYCLRSYHEEVVSEYWAIGGNSSESFSPGTSRYWKERLTFHLGFEVGYRFGTTENERMGWPF